MTAAECQNITKERKGLGLHSATFSEPNTEGKRLRLENKLKKLKNAPTAKVRLGSHVPGTASCLLPLPPAPPRPRGDRPPEPRLGDRSQPRKGVFAPRFCGLTRRSTLPAGPVVSTATAAGTDDALSGVLPGPSRFLLQLLWKQLAQQEERSEEH